AVQPIIHQHYGDDYLDSFFSLKEANETVKQVIKVHEYGGFHIRNFISNNRKLIETIPADRRQEKTSIVPLEEKQQEFEKILGVQWDTKMDCLSFKVDLQEFKNTDEATHPTKSQVLSFIMSVYDPLGLISYLTI
ncbi:hypothetical protein, partial [Acinetobacter baumannii]|uniref:hypothetical protein n=1 Tax=Acinetobacter baumannii TaxID=470 RepID=UPI00148F0BFC